MIFAEIFFCSPQKKKINIDSKHFAGDPGSSSGTIFRKKLMGVLQMPYDMKEHEDLSRRVRHKRQKTVEKSLRQGRDFTSSLGERCKSYLELYKGKIIYATLFPN